MRRAVFILTLAYVALYGWAWIGTLNASTDAAGRGMALGFISIGMMATAVFLIPALILAILDKAHKWALGLAVTPVALLVLVFLTGMV